MRPERPRRITRRMLVLGAFAAVTGLAACASGGGSSGPRRDPNLLTLEELTEYGTLTAADAVRRLRPRWLTGRGGGNQPQLVLDGARMGDAATALQSMNVSDIQEMRYLNAADATMRYGTNYPGGAIVVTRRGG